MWTSRDFSLTERSTQRGGKELLLHSGSSRWSPVNYKKMGYQLLVAEQSGSFQLQGGDAPPPPPCNLPLPCNPPSAGKRVTWPFVQFDGSVCFCFCFYFLYFLFPSAIAFMPCLVLPIVRHTCIQKVIMFDAILGRLVTRFWGVFLPQSELPNPVLLMPIEHVQKFKVVRSRDQKFHTVPVVDDGTPE